MPGIRRMIGTAQREAKLLLKEEWIPLAMVLRPNRSPIEIEMEALRAALAWTNSRRPGGDDGGGGCENIPPPPGWKP